MKHKNINTLITQYLIKKGHCWTPNYEIATYLIGKGINLEPLAIRYHIKQLRLLGTPIIASKCGYMMALNSKQLSDYIYLRKIEIKSELKALRKMRKWL